MQTLDAHRRRRRRPHRSTRGRTFRKTWATFTDSSRRGQLAIQELESHQVEAIREKSGEAAYQGIEKNLFHRICHMLTAHVQLIFIFDGPRRPHKHGRAARRVSYERTRLLKEVLAALRIPYHEAPGEAEAECARLQHEKIVDAVCSKDGDTLMFGCDFLIRDYRVPKKKGEKGTKKSGSLVRVIRPKELQPHGLDREGLVLFVMLMGGDYAEKLPRCSTGKAIKAVKASLGKSLCQCKTEGELNRWWESLQAVFKSSLHVPLDFLKFKAFKYYNTPTVSDMEKLHNLHKLKDGWDLPIDELKLGTIISERFNIWRKGHLNWIAPIILVRLFTQGRQSSTIPGLDLQVPRRRAKPDESAAPLERRVTFSPFHLTTFKLNDYQDGYWAGSKDVHFDPTHRVVCELPVFFLRKGVAAEVLDPPPAEPKTRKRKQPVAVYGITETRNQPAEKRKRKSPSKEALTTASLSKSPYSVRSPLPAPRSRPLAASTSGLSLSPRRQRSYILATPRNEPSEWDQATSLPQSSTTNQPMSMAKHTVKPTSKASYTSASTITPTSNMANTSLSEPRRRVEIVDLLSDAEDSDSDSDDSIAAIQLNFGGRSVSTPNPKPNRTMAVSSSKKARSSNTVHSAHIPLSHEGRHGNLAIRSPFDHPPQFQPATHQQERHEELHVDIAVASPARGVQLTDIRGHLSVASNFSSYSTPNLGAGSPRSHEGRPNLAPVIEKLDVPVDTTEQERIRAARLARFSRVNSGPESVDDTSTIPTISTPARPVPAIIDLTLD